MRKHLIALVIVLTAPFAAFALSISNAAVSNITSTSATVSWTTDVPSDSYVAFGIDGISEGVSHDANLVTSHTLKLKLWPDRNYLWMIRSQVGEQRAFYGSEQGAEQFYTPRAKLEPGPISYLLKVEAPSSVTQGYSALVGIMEAQTAGTDGWITTTVKGLPPHAELVWPDYQWNGMTENIKHFDSSSVTIWGAQRHQFMVRTTTATPLGSYHLTVTVTGVDSFSMAQSVTIAVVAVTQVVRKPISGAPPPLSSVATWEKFMVRFGQFYCGTARAGDQNSVSYYDGEAVFQQIKSYDVANKLTGNPAQWDKCITQAQAAYLDWMSQGAVADIWNFSEGLKNAALAGDQTANNAVAKLCTPEGAKWAKLWANTNSPWPVTAIRPVSYTLESFLSDEELGRPHPHQVEQTTAALLGVIDCIVNACDRAGSLQSFMGGLMSRALIDYATMHPEDARVLPAMMAFTRWLYVNEYNTWEAANAFGYRVAENRLGYKACDPCTIADLSMLNVAAFSWLYRQTGDTNWLVMGDAVWNGAVRAMPTYALAPTQDWTYGKGFSQAYRWSFSYLTWRDAVGSSPSPPSSKP
jgi:hypothetical protein